MCFGSILGQSEVVTHLDQNWDFRGPCRHQDPILHVKEKAAGNGQIKLDLKVVRGAIHEKVSVEMEMTTGRGMMVNWTLEVRVQLRCALQVRVGCVHLCCENTGDNMGTQGWEEANQA
jgi:hypothetical protein